ncbi:hypothetical protein D9613_006034 [Agrocybe pediades]|uniref:Uncharacterized protein n=1 Tax=Agrocybe pediades TaxID=84607 RepID=A0A8H4QUL9_9AGAR|nr:hypothetical protein D9613_006034 [Agrocybe pediades]
MQSPSRPFVARNDDTFIPELDKLKKLLQETNDDMKAHASRGCGEPESTGSANIVGGNNDETNLLEDVLLEASHIARITKEKKNVDEKVAGKERFTEYHNPEMMWPS